MLKRNEQYFDRLALCSTFMQIMDVAFLLSDSTNTDIIAEIQKQNTDYMETIIKQNNQILGILSNMDMSTVK